MIIPIDEKKYFELILNKKCDIRYYMDIFYSILFVFFIRDQLLKCVLKIESNIQKIHPLQTLVIVRAQASDLSKYIFCKQIIVNFKFHLFSIPLALFFPFSIHVESEGLDFSRFKAYFRFFHILLLQFYLPENDYVKGHTKKT